MKDAFTEADSPVRRMDPRVKVSALSVFAIEIAVANEFEVLVVAFMISLCWLLAARASMGETVGRLLPVNLFVFFLWLFLPFTIDGRPMFSLFGMAGSREGVLYGARIALKSNTVMLMVIAVMVSTPVISIGQALLNMGVPRKLVHLFFFTYRYIHVMFREYDRLANAMKIRSFRPRTSWHTYKSYAYLVGMILIRSHDRAARVYGAMRCRGFQGVLYSLETFSFHSRDLFTIMTMSAAVILLGMWEWVIN